MEAKSIDDVLVAAMNDTVLPPVVVENKPEPEPAQDEPESLPEAAEAKPEEVKKDLPNEKSDNNVDEYGNPVEKPKVYTEEEVNRLIRERLARGKFAEQQKPVETAPQASQEQGENWEAELETFVERTIEKRQNKLAEQQWKQQELARQAQFEDKFTNGANKYNDFREVISGKPITDTMMMATRDLENPAAFIYGAAKFHATELDRISKINDPYAQAAEIGRLHEKMIKNKNIISNAPKPIEAVTGDIPAKNISNLPSIEDRINQYAKQKRK